MKLSIVTAALNAADGLGETFGSLLEQTHADWEYVVIDGGSQDATVDILHEWDACYPGRVRWVSESDGGIYDAMNKGIALSTGDAIGFLGCGDTFYEASSLRYIDEALSSGVDAVFGDLIFVTRADRSRPVRIWRGSVPAFSAAAGNRPILRSLHAAIALTGMVDLMFRSPSRPISISCIAFLRYTVSAAAISPRCLCACSMEVPATALYAIL